ncbi:hypothetical protein I79_001447 [Cricetulus griseus]|uniref:Uncharacterized protein n=1 Tax=Cricetulus griseus TaxID=10029 RepID=G3GUS4_CRIGR|nr:hypothetical protein I79_001447 [Cricetulus griseus]
MENSLKKQNKTKQKNGIDATTWKYLNSLSERHQLQRTDFFAFMKVQNRHFMKTRVGKRLPGQTGLLLISTRFLLGVSLTLKYQQQLSTIKTPV